MKNGGIEMRSLNSTRPWQDILAPLPGYFDALEYKLQNKKQVSFNLGLFEKCLPACEVPVVIQVKAPYFQCIEKKSFSETSKSAKISICSRRIDTLLGWKPRLLRKEADLTILEGGKLDGNSNRSPIKSCAGDIQKLVFV
jgi:hypothetical protein